MTIVKKLFLMTALGLGLGAQLSASEPVLNFADYLDRNAKTPEPKKIATWIRSTYQGVDTESKALNEQLTNITGSNSTDRDKSIAIKKLWLEDTTPKPNESYFSSMSTMAKAAVALVVTASIASYFYFMRPWTRATAE